MYNAIASGHDLKHGHLFGHECAHPPKKHYDVCEWQKFSFLKGLFDLKAQCWINDMAILKAKFCLFCSLVINSYSSTVQKENNRCFKDENLFTQKIVLSSKISAKSITKLLLPQHLILRVVSLATLLKTSTSKDRLSSVSYHWWGRGLGNWIVWPEQLGIATGNKFNLVSHVQLNIILLYAATIRIKTRSTLNSHFLKSSIHILNKNSSMIFHVKWLRNI